MGNTNKTEEVEIRNRAGKRENDVPVGRRKKLRRKKDPLAYNFSGTRRQDANLGKYLSATAKEIVTREGQIIGRRRNAQLFISRNLSANSWRGEQTHRHSLSQGDYTEAGLSVSKAKNVLNFA